jgi:hypothetical protein
MGSGHGDGLGGVICISTEDCAKYWITVHLSILKTFQEHGCNALGSAVPIRTVIERVAVSGVG